MPSAFQLPLFLVALLLLAPTLTAEDAPLVAVDPVGKPITLLKGNAIRYFLWNDAHGWHLRSDSNGKRHVFSGSIDIVGGKLTKISNFENLEAGAKPRFADRGKFNKAKTQITFKFTTSIKRDGFDFQVDESAKQVRFKLKIDGKLRPRRVLIGAAGQPAPTDVLLLPAHPK